MVRPTIDRGSFDMHPRRLILCASFAALLLVILGGRAAAYPQFQFASGTGRCSQCHYAPDGGGLITAWGRDESGDTISLGGDGAFLHGLWQPPSWLALGADIRLAALGNASAGYESPEYHFFPMQADFYARVAFGDQVSLYLEGGIRGDTRPVDPSVSGRFTTITDRLISNEHYLMWRANALGPYLRFGRFFAPYGLRFVEHIFYVQRYTGFDLYNETYTVSGGYLGQDWELHLSLFAPPPLGFPDALQSVGVRQSGAAAYGEKRFNAMAMLALQARAGFGSEATWYQGGAVGKLWVDPARVLFLGEADFIHKEVLVDSARQNQFVSYLGATFFPVRGLMAGVAYERYQEDLAVAGTGHNAFDLQVNFFPWAHFELLALGRYQFSGPVATATDASASLLMFQLHYYL
jgi:hypothetical protein